MANQVPTIDQVTVEALSIFENNLVAAKRCNRNFEPLFGQEGAKRGDTVRIRKPAQASVRTGTAWQGQAIVQPTTTLTLSYQKGIDFSMTSFERKMDMPDLSKNVLKPYIVRLANELDKDILQTIVQNSYNEVGTIGTTPTSLSTYIQAGTYLTDQACPRGRGERNMLLTASAEGAIITDLRGLFNPQNRLGTQLETGEMNYMAGFNWDVDQNAYSHTNATYTASGTVNGGAQTGSSLITQGWTSGGTTLTQGTTFTLGSGSTQVNAVNPVTKADLGYAMRFVVTSTISDTTGAITIPFLPAIVGPGDPQQNVSQLPANLAAVTINGATGQISQRSVVFNEEAVTLAVVPLEKPDGVNTAATKYDKQSGVGLRYIEWYDGDTDLWKSRFDLVYGIAVVRPEWVVRIAA
jgi:hypothetical protein